MFYIAFLGLFSFVLLVDYFPRNNNGGQRNGFDNIQIPITEMCVHIGMLSVVIEEIVEVSLDNFFSKYSLQFSYYFIVSSILCGKICI